MNFGGFWRWVLVVLVVHGCMEWGRCVELKIERWLRRERLGFFRLSYRLRDPIITKRGKFSNISRPHTNHME